MEQITEPGTIDQLVTDAAERGYRAGARMIRDWTAAGLLDYPERRSAGKGHGSRPALYPARQRELFLTLLHHRPTNGIRSLARIPVGIWMYWGEAFVPLRQARRAMTTWLGDPRSSRRQAWEYAGEVLRRLDNPRATPAARKTLREFLADVAYTGRADLPRLERVVRDVFEPGAGQIRRAMGHPDAPFMAESIISLIQAHLAGIDRLARGDVTDGDFEAARHAHLVAFADYAVQQPQLARYAPAGDPNMYEPVTAEAALNSCCGNLLTGLGMAVLYPEGAARAARRAVPEIRFQS